MENYANKSGNSGVSTYEIGITYILVGFTKGGVYEYNYASAGESIVEKMKTCALAGVGLSSFIQQHAKYKYSRRIT